MRNIVTCCRCTYERTACDLSRLCILMEVNEMAIDPEQISRYDRGYSMAMAKQRCVTVSIDTFDVAAVMLMTMNVDGASSYP